MPQRYKHVYTRRVTDVSVVPVSLIADTISYENIVIPSPYVDIDSSINIDSHSKLDIPIADRKGTRSCTLHPLHNFLCYAHLLTQYHANTIYISFITCTWCTMHPRTLNPVKRRPLPLTLNLIVAL